jgi:ribose 5-phosphate isomerase A
VDDSLRLRRIGERVASEVRDGTIVGLGTGSTADAMLHALGDRVTSGLRMTGVATSSRTTMLAKELNIPLRELDDVDSLDLCIDGADEIDPDLNLVKGRGGALLYEKLVAKIAARFIIIASSEKLVDRLGMRLALPVEVVPLGWSHTARSIAALGLNPALRHTSGGKPFTSDGGHYILDCAAEPIADPAAIASSLKLITGVVEHGLFVGMADQAFTIDESGAISELHRHRPR